MRDQSASNFNLSGIFVILLLLASLMLFGFMTYLAWNQENLWPTSTQPRSGHVFTPPAAKRPQYAPAILLGEPPIPATNREGTSL